MNYNLYIARKENKMRQKDVAKLIGIHAQSYYLKETGKREFTISEGRKLAKLFNRSLDELFAEGATR